MSEHKPVIEVKKKSERQMQIETLQNELQTYEEKLSALKTEKETLKSYEIIGMHISLVA